jgi:predicted esterase
MPLVVAGSPEQPAATEAHADARKIHPRFAHGALVRVAVGRNLAEAELIKGMLLEQGIPSMLKRTRGFDVPDFLAAGPRDVLVPESGAEAARELLADADEASTDREAGVSTRSEGIRLAAGMLAALLVFGAVAGLLYALVA